LFALGYYRATTDIDILVPPTNEQAKRVIKALLVLPERACEQIDPAWFDEGETIRVADEIAVDLLFNACGETNETLARHAEIVNLDGIPLPKKSASQLRTSENKKCDPFGSHCKKSPRLCR